MIYPIVIYGSQVLRNKSVEINADYPDFKKLIEDMWLTLGEASGVGLAAPQIGKNIRLFIVDCTPWAEEVPELENFRRVFVNPEIYERSSETGLFEEGCLSLPGIHENVSRPLKIRMRYLDENFVEHDEEFEGYPARVIHRIHGRRLEPSYHKSGIPKATPYKLAPIVLSLPPILYM